MANETLSKNFTIRPSGLIVSRSKIHVGAQRENRRTLNRTLSPSLFPSLP